MKKQTLLQIQVKNLPEDGMPVHGGLTAADLDIPEDDRTCLPEPILLELHVTPVVGGVVSAGRAEVKIRCRCDRCLGYFTSELPPVRLDHQYPGFQGDVLDLTEDVRDDILLAFPSRCLCRAECKGLCPDCGQNLNARECDCRSEASDESPWAGLDKIRLHDGGEASEEAEK